MIRKLGLTLLLAGGFLSTSAFAITEHIFTMGHSMEYELPVNDPQVFSNILFWKITATCTIMSDPSETKLSVKMLKKTGSVNAIPLFAGDSLGIMVQSGDMLNITADSGAKVELVNLGTKSIRASCSAG